MLSARTHADALHQAGRRAEAEARFREAEQMQAERQPDYPLLYSLQGFRYCDLLLTEAERAAWRQGATTVLSPAAPRRSAHSPVPTSRVASTLPEIRAAEEQPTAIGMSPLFESCRAVSERAAETLQWTEAYSGASLLDIAVNRLSLARAALYAAVLSSAAPSSLVATPADAVHFSGVGSLRSAPTSHLESAVTGLRHAGQQHYLPYGLLTRAWLRSLTGVRFGPESAKSDLDEAWEVAERGPMPLFMADIHLHRARLFGATKDDLESTTYPWQSAAADLAEARRLIVKHGYLRRMEELEDAEAAILNRPPAPKTP